ncbi:MAG: NADH-quinone oxidoreductase subunit M [Verrucomicrobiae bacterium]|nr:NADH-quinone oxidoreductase subunit M [Verrucomicrobiae bacterium]
MSPLTLLPLLPLLGALTVLMLPRHLAAAWRGVALGVTGVTVLIATTVFVGFPVGHAGYHLGAVHEWIPALGLNYRVGVDGLSVGLVFVASLVSFAAAWISEEIRDQCRLYYVLLLLIVAGVFGALISLDLFFLYFFNELALVPTFLMIGIWGRGEDRTAVTFQITLYLSLGALVALAGLVCLYALSGANTLDVVALSAWLREHPLPAPSQVLIFGLLLFGFGTLVGLWPFHSWAPAGYAAAPTATAMLHAGLLKKIGALALLRAAFPLLPEGVAAWTRVLAILCLGNLLYCGWVAMRQRDLNLLFGNSSLAHMGFVFLGLASVSLIGITGAVVVMVAHALLAPLEFALGGHLRRQTGTLDLGSLGGLMRTMPFIGAALVAALLAGCGVPGFASFAGELTVMFGVWKALPWFVVAAAWGGLILGGVYMLRAIREVAHGPAPETGAAGGDVTWTGRVPYLVLLLPMIFFGVAPFTLVDRIRPSAAWVVERARPSAAPDPAVVTSVVAIAPPASGHPTPVSR